MLSRIELPEFEEWPPLSAKAKELLDEADRRIDLFVHRRSGRLIHDFVPSDFPAVDSHLNWILERRLNAGLAFCEWGCGFGVVSMLAALQGFDACGIEVEAELVAEAMRLSDDLEIPAEFAHGSLIPEDGAELIVYYEDMAHIDIDSPSGYEDLDLDITDFDLFFAFPWPGEERFYEDLFDQRAADGALLLTYHGIDDLRLNRKVG